jgi:homoserine O-succinyltransferase
MPVVLDHELPPRPWQKRTSPFGGLTIGLVNNMPDGAVQATERQFVSLLDEAAGSLPIRLKLYTLPGVPRSDSMRQYLSAIYRSADTIQDDVLDGLIVTGTEPRASRLDEEPYWRDLTELIDWAAERTPSAIWSCLAAHAAVLHLDRVERHPLKQKLSGALECQTVADHSLLTGAAGRYTVPHSRCNELREDELVAAGYRILSRTGTSGVDTFVRERKSLFVFFQGHPEYDALSLLGEYRRDVRRYLRQETGTYPAAPVNYFDATTERELAAFRERAMSQRTDALMDDFPDAQARSPIASGWRSFAVRIYRNWLSLISLQALRRKSDELALPSVRSARPWPAAISGRDRFGISA